MARQRMINPAFFVDEDVARMSPLARLMFQGLWTLADKRGRLEDRPARIKVQTLPYDECDAEALLAEVAAGGFIVRYESGGRKVIQIRSFGKHQRPHPKEPDSALPAPPELAVEKHGKPELAGRVRSESESVPSGSSGPSESDAVAAPRFSPSPFIRPGERPLWEAEALRLTEEIATLTNRDGAEVFREAQAYDGQKPKSNQTNPAMLSEGRLQNTVLDLRRMKADFLAARSRAADEEQRAVQAETAKRVWQQRAEAPASVASLKAILRQLVSAYRAQPLDFVAWCKTRNIPLEHARESGLAEACDVAS
jgi:hypothetical protein